MKNKKNIAFILNNFQNGGIEHFFINALLPLRNYGIYIVTHTVKDTELKKELEKRNVFFIHTKNSYKNNKVKYIGELNEIFKKNNIDVVHTNLSIGDAYVLIAAKIAGVPERISHSHMIAIQNSKNLLKRLVFSAQKTLISLLSTKKIACSIAAGKSLFRHNFKIIPNIINEAQFTFSEQDRKIIRKEYNIPQNAHVLLFIGRLHSDKNPLQAIDIFKKYVSNNINNKRPCYMFLIGDGPIKKDVLKQLSSTHNIIYIENTKAAERFMSASDLLLITSHREGLSIVSIEAQFNSLPVLASDTLPEETNISDLIHYIPLNNYNLWLKTIESCLMHKRANNSLNDRATLFTKSQAQKITKELYG